MLQQENFHSIHPRDVRGNTHYVHRMVTLSAVTVGANKGIKNTLLFAYYYYINAITLSTSW